jgi:hypothetical protein
MHHCPCPTHGAPLPCKQHAAGWLQVYSLPGLDQLAALSLEEAVPWPLALPADRWAASVAVGQGGEVLVLAANHELLRLAVAYSTRLPAPPASLYDWELAAAAHAANVALEKALARTPATLAPAMQQLGSSTAAEPSSSSAEAAAPSVPDPADKQPAGTSLCWPVCGTDALGSGAVQQLGAAMLERSTRCSGSRRCDTTRAHCSPLGSHPRQLLHSFMHPTTRGGWAAC